MLNLPTGGLFKVNTDLHKQVSMNWMPQLAYHGDLKVFLKRLPLFKDLTNEELHNLISVAVQQKLPPGALVFEEGDRADNLCIVLRGSALVRVRVQPKLDAGSEAVLTRECSISRTAHPAGTRVLVEMFDAYRKSYPFVVRVVSTGDRGRVFPEDLREAPPNVSSPRMNPRAFAQKEVARVGSGEYFGMSGLLRGGFRTSTVLAGPEGLEIYVIGKGAFYRLAVSQKIHFGERRIAFMAGVAASHALSGEMAQREIANAEENQNNNSSGLSPDGSGNMTKSIIVKDTKKDTANARLIADALDKNSFLNDVLQLSVDDRLSMVNMAYKKVVPKGAMIIRAGEKEAPEGSRLGAAGPSACAKFYIVESGKLSAKFEHCNGDRFSSQGQLAGEYTTGDSFGELSLLYDAKNELTVQAVEDSTLWVIDPETFVQISRQTYGKKMQELMRVLDSIPTFDCLFPDEKALLAESLEEKQYLRGEFLLKGGEMGDTFFILLSGSIARGHKRVRQPGTYFGDQSLVDSMPIKDSVVAESDDVLCATIDRHHFEYLLGPLWDMQAAARKGEERQSCLLKYQAKLSPAPRREVVNVPLPHFHKLGLLGCGAFGVVTLEQAVDGERYALKQLNKGMIVQKGLEQAVLREKEALIACDSPFIVKCYATYSTRVSLYFLLELCLGGEVYTLYHKFKWHGNVDRARFYVASALSALAHLHERQIMLRDLKPENLVLNKEGRCKLADLGLCRYMPRGKCYTTCGTPEYMAPEVIQQRGYGRAVDLWALGVLLHELLSGHTPFDAPSAMESFQRAVRGVAEVDFSFYEKRTPDGS